MTEIKSICVFCGSSTGENKIYSDAAKKLGQVFVKEGITLVYGGAKVGLMGIIADEVLLHGGKVIGVIPDFFSDKEIAHNQLSELIYVDSMAERKAILAERSDAFIAMPGGFGTLDELFEAVTLIQTEKIEHFPIVLVSKSYWGGLMEWIKTVMLEQQKNISPSDLDLIQVVDTADEAVEIINKFYSKSELRPNF